ncbi:major facilitator superfamily domain-containing protein [Mrakia frigida]|uniref:major facilitator superfamily domain-containing protein n=1 Tax=Mrakia frigida TaxID=29902 RepID=UPI003FCBF0F3
MSTQAQQDSSRNQEILSLDPIAHFDEERKVAPGLDAGSTEIVVDNVEYTDQTKQKQSILGWLWDTADLGMEERRLLLKLDTSLLVFASLGYFIKNLDQTNINNAFLSGMKEDLNMYGNELVTASSLWTTGYVIGQLPILILLTKVNPRYVIPTLEFVWGILTLATYSVKDMKTLYAIRFLVGLAESGFYPACHYLLGSYYTPRELAKRTSIFYVSGALGGMFSGFIQTGAYKNLDGVHGLEGWRWIFIIDAIITIPIAILGFIFLPGLPWNAKPTFWLSQKDIDLAAVRMKAIGRKEAQPWTKAKVSSGTNISHFCPRGSLDGLPLPAPGQRPSPFLETLDPSSYDMLYNNAIAQSPFGFWLKSFNADPKKGYLAPVPGVSFSVPQINLWPLPGTAVFVVLSMLYAWLSDGPLKGKRYPFVLFGSLLNIVVNAVLRSTPLYTNFKLRQGLYYLLPAAGSIGALVMNWITEITGGDNESRAVIIGAANDLAYVIQAVAPNFIWKTSEFPKARKGHAWSISLSTIELFWVGLVLWFVNRDKKRRLQDSRDDDEILADNENDRTSSGEEDSEKDLDLVAPSPLDEKRNRTVV